MSGKAEIWQCPECGEAHDISELGFYAEVECIACGCRERVHTMLANFRVEGVVGIGGMSVVLRARDLVLNRAVAIKVLNDTYRNQPDRISRFENECAMMAKVRHENVVSVYSAGRARKQFYIVMELVDGLDLETLISREGPLEPTTAVDYAIQVVEGLNAAHKSGLLHRDMKPGNIIITPEGKAKVLDFGLALGRQDEDTEEIIWATPFYVPPETLERKDEDERTDIYALGMTLRYLLTGKGSFKNNASSVSDLLHNKLHLPAAASILPGVDDSLCELVDHMTAYEPSKRPVSYRALLTELRAVKEALLLHQKANTPEMRRKARRSLFISAGSTFALGIVAAVVAAVVATPADVRNRLAPAYGEYLLPSQQMLREAEANLQTKDYGAAYEGFRSISGEAGIEAWAALNAAMLLELKGSPQDAVDDALAQFRSLLNEKSKASPAGVGILQSLEAVASALEGKQVAAGDMPKAVVRMHHYFWLARHLNKKGKSPEARVAMEKAIREAGILAENNVVYGGAGTQFEHMLTVWIPTPVGAVALAQQVTEALSQHRLADARVKLNELLKQEKLSARDAVEARVMLEVCDVAEAAFDVLKRRCGDKYAPGATPKEVSVLASGLKIPRFSDEVSVLCLLLNKNYREASTICDILKLSAPDSPFAVLTQDWRKRLKQAGVY